MGAKPETGISRQEIETRIEQTRALMAQKGLQALLVVGRSFYDRPGNLAYLTNHFPSFPASVVSGEMRGLGHGMLVLPLEKAPALAVDYSYLPEKVAIADVRVNANLTATVIEIVKEKRLTRAKIGIAGEDILPLTLYRELAQALHQVAWERADEMVVEQRMIKSESEIELLKRAAEIADKGMEAALAAIEPNKRENEVCARGIARALEAGADFVRYLRVHSGDRSGLPPASSREMKRGELVRLDLIGAYQGYGWDILRSTTVGKPSDAQRKLLETSLEATEKTIDAARPGVKMAELVEVALKTVVRAGYDPSCLSPFFIGHGIGLETVEDPFLRKGVTAELKEGMVLCIEPVILAPGVGWAAVEQEIVARKGAPEVISRCATRVWA